MRERAARARARCPRATAKMGSGSEACLKSSTSPACPMEPTSVLARSQSLAIGSAPRSLAGGGGPSLSLTLEPLWRWYRVRAEPIRRHAIRGGKTSAHMSAHDPLLRCSHKVSGGTHRRLPPQALSFTSDRCRRRGLDMHGRRACASRSSRGQASVNSPPHRGGSIGRQLRAIPHCCHSSQSRQV